jgi:hypothetical protein
MTEPEPDDFIAYAVAADELIAKASEDELAEVAKLLALNLVSALVEVMGIGEDGEDVARH